jgi:hypothetical protein
MRSCPQTRPEATPATGLVPRAEVACPPPTAPHTYPEERAPTRLEARAEVACPPSTAACGTAPATRDDATWGLSKREKRKAHTPHPLHWQQSEAQQKPQPGAGASNDGHAASHCTMNGACQN